MLNKIQDNMLKVFVSGVTVSVLASFKPCEQSVLFWIYVEHAIGQYDGRIAWMLPSVFRREAVY